MFCHTITTSYLHPDSVCSSLFDIWAAAVVSTHDLLILCDMRTYQQFQRRPQQCVQGSYIVYYNAVKTLCGYTILQMIDHWPYSPSLCILGVVFTGNVLENTNGAEWCHHPPCASKRSRFLFTPTGLIWINSAPIQNKAETNCSDPSFIVLWNRNAISRLVTNFMSAFNLRAFTQITLT